MDLRNKLKYTLTVLLLFAGFSADAQSDKPSMSSGELQFYVDKAVFAGKEGKSYVEFYFMFFADQIDFSNGNKGEIEIKVVINNAEGNNVSEREWTLEVSLDENTEIKTKVFYDQVNEYLKSGRYDLLISARDLNSKLKGELQSKIEVTGINNSSFTTSEIEFVSSINKSSGSSHFSKGNKTIVPNPSRRYGILNPILYFYYELYNIVPDENKLDVYYSVDDLNSEYTKNFPLVQLSKNSTTAGITHGLNVGNLPSGIYKLNIVITDSSNDAHLIFYRDFEIIQFDFAEKKSGVSEEDAEVFENIISIIGTESQLKRFRTLSLNGKSEYMVEFWKSVDPSPGTPENEYLQKIQQRFSFANKNFGWGDIEGWRTERGRILIKYGNPDEMEQHQSESDTYPYEIWIYNQERRFIFVFGDLTNNGRYVLIHSDKEGEISNDRWKDYIQKM